MAGVLVLEEGQQLLMQQAGLLITTVLVVVAGLIIMWIVVSIPVWIAAKIVTAGKARFSRAMLVTAAGPIVYGLVFFLSSAALSATIGVQFLVAAISFVLAFAAWIGVFKVGFDTGWFRALGIAILATIVFIIIGAIVTVGLQAIVPDAPQITPFPSF
ncbi:hypothetical protein [Nitrososphaera sp.]|uniref:hypothetical protein n=1 Tax=Nitrososphaera sp. TaxID=1971748 RepID=UPI00307D7D8E